MGEPTLMTYDFIGRRREREARHNLTLAIAVQTADEGQLIVVAGIDRDVYIRIEKVKERT